MCCRCWRSDCGGRRVFSPSKAFPPLAKGGLGGVGTHAWIAPPPEVSSVRRGSPDPAGVADRRSPERHRGLGTQGESTLSEHTPVKGDFGQAIGRGQETRAQLMPFANRGAEVGRAHPPYPPFCKGGKGSPGYKLMSEFWGLKSLAFRRQLPVRGIKCVTRRLLGFPVISM